MSVIETQIDSNLGIITLNNSENGNRLNKESLKSLTRAFTEALNNKNVRAILIRSNGKNFCLGMDLEFLQNIHENKKEVEESVDLYRKLLLSIYHCPKAVISLINGNVKAGGIGLISACDINISSDSSSFELSEVIFGLIPANVLPFLYSLRLPPQKVRYLIMTAKAITAKEAKDLNLIDEVYPVEELEKKTKSLIKTLFRAAPHAIEETKKFTAQIFLESIKKSSDQAKDKLLQLIEMPEVIQGVKNFNEGGIPDWFGKFKPERPLLIKNKKD